MLRLAVDNAIGLHSSRLQLLRCLQCKWVNSELRWVAYVVMATTIQCSISARQRAVQQLACAAKGIDDASFQFSQLISRTNSEPRSAVLERGL